MKLHITPLLVFSAIGLSSAAHSAVLSTSVEPVIGYERVTKTSPTVHSKDRLIYGGRVTVGVLWISAEGEYLRGTDTEDFPSQSMTTRDTTDKVRIGLRSTIRLLGLLSFTARAGGQASRNKHEQTISGVTNTTDEPIKYHPYAGAGLKVGMGRGVSLTADITTVFPDFPSMARNEYQVTSGIAVSLP